MTVSMIDPCAVGAGLHNNYYYKIVCYAKVAYKSNGDTHWYEGCMHGSMQVKADVRGCN